MRGHMYMQNARERLPTDKGATLEDAERVVSAEIRNKAGHDDHAWRRGGRGDYGGPAQPGAPKAIGRVALSHVEHRNSESMS